jgi:phosphatidyl-myo-inositol dimannoside synthase
MPIAVYSMHDPKDAAIGNQYFPAEIFKGFDAAKVTFIKNAVQEGIKSKVVILSHINLLLAAWAIKKINPSVQIILMAHGIEVWKPLSKRLLIMLSACNKVVSVSSFTKDKVLALHHLTKEKCFVLNNCIDPFLDRPIEKKRNAVLVERYNIKETDTVLLTLTRLSFKDRYKGYSYVLESLGEIVKQNKNIKYILAGSYEASEKIYIDDLIGKYELANHVILSGFIAEEELPAHFALADLYIMPSMKEGFGIVFVEAMYYGVPVIAGNADGSVDALLHGQLGLLINPDDVHAITDAMQKMITNRETYIPDQCILMDNFGYSAYKRKLENIILN